MLMFIHSNSWEKEKELEEGGVSGFTVTHCRRCRHEAQHCFFWQRGAGTAVFFSPKEAASPVPLIYGRAMPAFIKLSQVWVSVA